MTLTATEIVQSYAAKSNLFDEHFKTKHPELWHMISVYGSMSQCKIATRRLLGIGVGNGPLPYIDQIGLMDKVHLSKDSDLISFFRTLVQERNGLYCSDMAEISTYVSNAGIKREADSSGPVFE